MAAEAVRDTLQPAYATKACVWDLTVIGFERQAWLERALANPAGPGLDAYLARQLDAAF